MKINVNRTEKVQAALDAVQEGTRAGIFDADEVLWEAKEAESRLAGAGIPKSLRKGATVVAHQRTGTKRWAYPTSVIYLERGTSGWFLTGVVRDNAWDERRVRSYTPDGFDYQAHAQRVLRAAGMVA